MTDCSLLAACWYRCKTDCISHGHLHISFHNAHYFRSTKWLLPLIYRGASYVENVSLTARSRFNMQHSFPPYFSRCLLVNIFLISLSISLHTYILQRIIKDNNNKNTTHITYLRRWPFNHATITLFQFLSELFLYSFLVRLAVIHAYIKITTQLHIPFKIIIGHSSAIPLGKQKYHGTNVLVHKILVRNPVTVVIPVIYFTWISLWLYTSHPPDRILPGVTGEFPKIQQQYHHGSKPIPQNGIINWNGCNKN